MLRRSLFITIITTSLISINARGETTWAPRMEDYVDTNKYHPNPATGDKYLCWSATASNLLEWGNHRWSFSDISGNPIMGADSQLASAAINNTWHDYFMNHWTDDSFVTQLALRWIFEGIDTGQYNTLWWIIKYTEYGSQLECPECPGGASYTEGTYGLTFMEEPGISTPVHIQNLLASSPVGVSIYWDRPDPDPDEQHVITCYGIEYNDLGGGGVEYQGIWYTDSDYDDQGTNVPLDKGGVRHYQPIIMEDGKWFLDYYGSGATHEIVALTALAPATIPTFTVTPTHGPNGTIYPDTPFTAEYDENVTFYATYDTGYEVDKWYVNGEVAFTGDDNIVLVITEPTTVLVTFKPDGMTPSQILVAGSTNPDIFEFSMQPDDSQSLLIPVYNPGTSSTVVNVSKSGTASSWTSLESTSFTLASHELKKFQITVDSPDGVASGTYALNISFNGIVQPISIRVADLGDDYHVNLSPSTASINGNNTCVVDFQFNNVFYDYFDISGKYQTFAQTYCDLSENQYINAEDYYLVLWVENLGATNQNLIVKMNNQPIGTITTDQVAIGEIDQYRISGEWETLTSGQNVLTFGLSQWDQSSTIPLWRIYDGIMEYYGLGDLLYLETCLTTSAYVSSPINLPSNVLHLINDGYMASARVYGTVTSCSSDGKVYLYNNGQNVDSENIYTSEVGDREYWSLGKSELASSNLFALKGDSSTEPVVGLSNLKLEITFNTNDPVLDVKKQLSSNRIQLGQQTTVTVHVENTAEGSSTGYDTDLKDSLPPGLTLSGGVLNKSNIGKLNFEDTYTNTYTITANQVGHYTLPSARVDYETYDGDPVIDESVPVDLNVVYGQLTVNEPNVIYSRLVNESGIHLSAVVLDVDGITPITDADVYAIVEKDFGDVLLWQVIYIVPMGWSQTDQSYIGITPAVQYGGNYRATIVAQKDWYEDGQSEQAVFYVHEPKPDITGEGVINLLDYSLLAARWLNDCNNQNNWCDGADIDHSGFVGFEDLLIMAEQWLSDSLVGYWSFDDSGAITAIDYSGNNNDGKIYGALPISGISGQALSFDGVDDYIEFPPLTNGSKTFSFCFKTTATGVERFLSYDGGYYQDLWSIQLDSNGKVLFGAREIESGDCPQLIGSNMVNDGQWHHLVLVLNTETNESTLYIDGEVQAYSSQLTSDLTMFDHVFYGMWDNFNYNGAYTNGTIDEIRIYNRVLSAAEIQSLYQNP